MYANYNSDHSNQLGRRALELKAHGVESSRSFYADLLNKPTNYYSATDGSTDNFISRVKFQNTNSTIYNNSETDPQMRAALVHRIIMACVSGLIEENDKKFLSYICYAIVRGDIDALKKLLNGLVRSFPDKLEAYIKTLNEIFNDQGAGICFTYHRKDMILLHIYHAQFAIAIDPTTASAAVLPIFTDWDGTVFFAEGEVSEPGSEALLAIIQSQCIQRVLLKYEDYEKALAANQLPVVHEEPGSSEINVPMIPELLNVARNDLAA